MSESVNFEPGSVVSGSDRLLISLFIAAIIHAILILGIHYSPDKPNRVSKSIEITLVNTKAPKAPPKARFLAQEHQIGAGEKKTKPEPPKQKIPSSGEQEQKALTKHILPEPQKPQATQKVIVRKTPAIAPEINTSKEDKVTPTPKPQTVLSPEALQMQVAEVGKQSALNLPSEDETRTKSINTVSTHKYLAAQYISDWEAKVERTGNLNYPEVARKKNFNGRLTMEVGIKADGSVYSIHISKSSGFQGLDDAAKRIVSMSAPFPPLPKELTKELDILVITRVWSFSDESGMTTH